jgi:hypothetical protein
MITRAAITTDTPAATLHSLSEQLSVRADDVVETLIARLVLPDGTCQLVAGRCLLTIVARATNDEQLTRLQQIVSQALARADHRGGRNIIWEPTSRQPSSLPPPSQGALPHELGHR